jgi:mannose-6-phosphate isomerase-like protein (cupin superfamily)
MTPARPSIRPLDPAAEYATVERCHIIEISNTADDPAASIARARVEPGVTTRWHLLLDTTERYVILSGVGVVEVGDLPPRTLGAGDVVVIPPRCRQRIRNAGTTDLLFLAICTPRFVPQAYRDAEDDAGGAIGKGR